MRRAVKEYRVRDADAQRMLAHHLKSLADRERRTQNTHARVLQHFLAFMRGDGRESTLVISEQRIVQWMTTYSSQHAASSTARTAFQVVTRYLALLTCEGLTASNLMTVFQKRHSDASWDHIAHVLQAGAARAALARLRRGTIRPGPLQKHIQAYVDLNRAVGKSYAKNHQVLLEFDRFLRSQAIRSSSSVTPRLIERWMRSMTCRPGQRVQKVRMVKRFFDHLIAHDLIRRNPVASGQEVFGRLSDRSFKPHIYTKAQVAAILAKAKRLSKNHLFPLRPHVCYAIIGMLYALGLRIGEACRLRIEDVDLQQNVLLVRQTKFHKSRMVPFGPRLAACLQRYLHIRHTVLQPVEREDPLFVTLWRRPLSGRTIGAIFRKLLSEVGLDNLNGGRRPRVHDLRHTFAVHRLLRWYCEGVDVQSHLMLLATFMGHVRIQSTEVYLTMTAELLNEANDRFHRRFGNRIAAEGPS